ncbi:MAG: putative manganese-dependent inorganic diphosphatase [Planctomycetota bacterium]|nr:putative manganese-dependent inorganic diphosphatase [Planctomycetota bacterium]
MTKKISQRYRHSTSGIFRSPEAPAADQVRTIVIGHKNPDTDCVAAAAGYAALKLQMGQTHVQAACAGLPSPRTEFLFQKFNVPMPPVIADVHPRVKDLVDTHPPTIFAGQTLLDGLTLLQRSRRRRLPVVDAKGAYLGMVSLFDLANKMVLQQWETDQEGAGGSLVGREVETSISHATEVLRAKPLSLSREGEILTLEVYVGAMSEKTLRTRMNKRDRDRVALVVGDREEVHRMAVDLKLRLVILTGGCAMEEGLLKQARASGVSVIQTAYDSATTVRRLKFSPPADLRLQEDATVLHLDEKLSDVRELLRREREEGFSVVDDRGRFQGMLWAMDMEEAPPLRLILVDHNELSQAIDGADEVPIVEILDHHRLGPQPTQTPIVFINDVVGSTCTLVSEQFRRFGHAPSAEMAGILMGGIITDTLLLRSPTSTPRDAAALDWLKGIARYDPKQLADEVFNVGSSIAVRPAREVLTGDKKDYESGKFTFAVAQVEEVGFENFFQHRGELLREMKALRRDEKFDFFALLVTNVVRETSMMLCAGEKRLLDMLPYNRLDEHTFDLPGVMSRKKQLLPVLLKIMS